MIKVLYNKYIVDENLQPKQANYKSFHDFQRNKKQIDSYLHGVGNRKW